jgi:hypothetical protein
MQPVLKFPLELIQYVIRGTNYKGKLSGESALAYEWRIYLTDQIIRGHLKALFVHIPNELPSNKMNKIDMMRYGAKLNAMGRLAGASDYLFGNGEGMWAIEVKYGDNKQTDFQKLFEQLCGYFNVPYKVIYSLDEGIEALKEWKILT